MPLYALIVFIHNSFSEIAGAFTVTVSLPEGKEVIFTFWNGMELQTQIHILELGSDSLVVFRDQDWRRPADIL